MKKGKVYLLAEMGNELRYKIGVTKNDVKKRVKQLSTGNSNPIDIIHVYETVNYNKVEKLLHRSYANKHNHLEWFTLSDEEVSNFLNEAKKFDDMVTMLLKSNPFYH